MSDVRHEIETSNAAFSVAIAAQDLDGVAAFYTEDATLLLEGMPEQRGRDAIENFFRVAFSGGLQGLRFVTEEVRAFGQVAVERGAYEMTFAGAPDQRGRYVVVHLRGDDGVWRALYDVTQSADSGIL